MRAFLRSSKVDTLHIGDNATAQRAWLADEAVAARVACTQMVAWTHEHDGCIGETDTALARRSICGFRITGRLQVDHLVH